MLDILNHIPEAAHQYCQYLLNEYRFKFVLKNKRLTKLGDFRNDKASGEFTISVNKTLNQYQFLITFIHELAHLKVAVEQSSSVKSHGSEWKIAFKELLNPLLNNSIFPEPLLAILIHHMINPKAAAGSDPRLWNALLVHNRGPIKDKLNSIEDNSSFLFRNKRFVKVKKRRTRILCKDENSSRIYLIPGIAEVIKL